MRSSWKSILLWLFVIKLGIACGAGLYEARVGTCQWDETHPVKKLLYNIRAWLIFNLAHTPNHCLIVR